MKRKIALTLAAVMTISSLLPMNLFAASNSLPSYILPGGYDVKDGNGQLAPGGDWTPLSNDRFVQAGLKITDINGNSTGINNQEIVATQGSNIIVQLLDSTKEGSFFVELDGGTFAYATSAAGIMFDGTVPYKTTFGDWFHSNLNNTTDVISYWNASSYSQYMSTGYFDATKDVNLLETKREDVTVNQIINKNNTTAITAGIAALLTKAAYLDSVGDSTNVALTDAGSINDMIAANTANGLTTGLSYADIITEIANAVAVAAPIATDEPSLDLKDVIKRNEQVTSLSFTAAQVALRIEAMLTANTTLTGASSIDDVVTVINSYFADNLINKSTVANDFGLLNYKKVADAIIYADTNNTNASNYRVDAPIYTYAQGSQYGDPINFEITPTTNRNIIQVHYRGDVRPYDYLVIPVPYINTTDGSVIAKIAGSTTGSVTPANVTLANQGGISSTVSFDTATTGNYRIYLPKITVTERLAGTIKNEVLEITAPEGYYFPKAYNTTATINAYNYGGVLGSANISVADIDEALGNYGDNSTIKLQLTGINNNNRTLLGRVEVTGLVIAPKDPDRAEYNKDLKVGVSGWGASLNRGDGAVVAQRDVWYVGIRAENYQETVNSGKVGQFAGTVVVNEQTEASWWTRKETTFTLTEKNEDGTFSPVEGVKISQIRIGTSNMSPGYEYNEGDKDKGERFTLGNNTTNVVWDRSGNAVRLVDFNPSNTGKRSNLLVHFWITVDPNFTSDVEGKEIYVSVTDNNDVFAQAADYSENTVLIATAKPTTLVTVEKTTAKTGYQQYDTVNITIKEREKGLWNTGEVQIKLGEYGTGIPYMNDTYLYFGAVSKNEVTVANADNTALTISGIKSTRNSGITFNIDRKSDFITSAKKNEPAEITLTNVILNIDRAVPYGEFDVIVGGKAILPDEYATVASLTDSRFFAAGYVAPSVIEVKAENAPFQGTIDVYFETGEVSVNNGDLVPVTDPAPFIDENTDRLMVPIRFISETLAEAAGVTEQVVFWNAEDRTCTVKLFGRVVVFTDNSAAITADGITYTLQNEDGTLVTPYIDPESDRFVIPFRGLGEALGFNVVSDNYDLGYVSYESK